MHLKIEPLKKRIALQLLLILALYSCTKEESSINEPNINNLLVDTVRHIFLPEDLNHKLFITYDYDSDGNIKHMKRVVENPNDFHSCDSYIEIKNSRLIVVNETNYNHTISIDTIVYPLNSYGYIIYDSVHYSQYYYEEDYLIKVTFKDDSTFYSVLEGNLVREIREGIDFLPDRDNETITWDYEYYNIDNYLNNAFYDINAIPSSFFQGKSSKELVKSKKHDGSYPNLCCVERYLYTFDINNRVIEVITESQNSRMDWNTRYWIQIIYKNPN